MWRYSACFLAALAVPSLLSAQEQVTPQTVCADIADFAPALLNGADIRQEKESTDPRNPRAPSGCRVTLSGGQATGRDPLDRINRYLRERGWVRDDRVRSPVHCRVRRIPEPKSIEVICLPAVRPRPNLPVTRLRPGVHSESQRRDPNLIYLPDGRVLPKPSLPSSPMTDKPLDWKAKP